MSAVGSTGRQMSVDLRAARIEAAAVREMRDRRHHALDFLQPVSAVRGAAAEPRQRGDEARACRDATARGRCRRELRSSTMRPAYMTRDAAADIGDEAEIVADHQHRRALRRRRAPASGR